MPPTERLPKGWIRPSSRPGTRSLSPPPPSYGRRPCGQPPSPRRSCRGHRPHSLVPLSSRSRLHLGSRPPPTPFYALSAAVTPYWKRPRQQREKEPKGTVDTNTTCC